MSCWKVLTCESLAMPAQTPEAPLPCLVTGWFWIEYLVDFFICFRHLSSCSAISHWSPTKCYERYDVCCLPAHSLDFKPEHIVLYVSCRFMLFLVWCSGNVLVTHLVGHIQSCSICFCHSLVSEKADILTLRSTLDGQFHIKLADIEIMESIGSGEYHFFHGSRNLPFQYLCPAQLEKELLLMCGSQHQSLRGRAKTLHFGRFDCLLCIRLACPPCILCSYCIPSMHDVEKFWFGLLLYSPVGSFGRVSKGLLRGETVAVKKWVLWGTVCMEAFAGIHGKLWK